jgi:NADPH:quinone reductase-like Zn-dependent oxidoreductase
MRAIVYRHYGGPEVLECEEVPRPVPGEGELLVRVHAASINPMDSHFIHRPLVMRLGSGLRRPKPTRPGTDLAGVVEAVGAGITRFRVGDAVFGTARGALADYVCAREDKLAAKPDGLSFADAAALPVAGLTALQALRDKGGLRAGQTLLVLGASGGVGTFAVQIGKMLGAHVTGLCGPNNVDLVRSLGADRVIDYSNEDVLRSGERYDLVLDLVGTRSLRALRPVLAPSALVLPCGMLGAGGVPGTWWFLRCMARMMWGAFVSRFGRRKLRFFMAKLRPEDLATLAALAVEGKVQPVIGGSYPLEQAREAVGQVAGGHARGKIIVTVSD